MSRAGDDAVGVPPACGGDEAMTRSGANEPRRRRCSGGTARLRGDEAMTRSGANEPRRRRCSGGTARLRGTKR
ncbi:hypothetical protein V959_01244 [Mycobacterium tuberculosis TB_RSA49]|nr:hypothetical protein V959_01244 [Mycobacterium tuberculosis TB_RSA49]